MHDLSTATSVYKAMKERLMNDFGLEEGEETLLDTLEGATDLQDLIAKAAREARHEEAMAKAIADIVSEAQGRKNRRLAKAERLRGAISWAMQDAGLKKIDAPDCTISVRAGKPKLIINGEPGIETPPEFVNVKEVYSWDREALAIAVTSFNQNAMDIAHYANPEPVLTLRGK